MNLPKTCVAEYLFLEIWLMEAVRKAVQMFGQHNQFRAKKIIKTTLVNGTFINLKTVILLFHNKLHLLNEKFFATPVFYWTSIKIVEKCSLFNIFFTELRNYWYTLHMWWKKVCLKLEYFPKTLGKVEPKMGMAKNFSF